MCVDAGDKYVGQWRRGAKHGYGRYLFRCGDVYDGDFTDDRACGQGVYK
jgi:hypothetical protein